MSGRVIDLLARLAPRERILLGFLALVVLPTGLWFGALVPLQERREAAQAALQEARALEDWVAQRAAEMSSLEAASETGPRTPVGLSALEQSLISADLRRAVTGLANRTGGGIELRFDAVGFDDLMGWLSAQNPGWGYDIATFRILRSDAPGVVAADVRLVPQG